MSENEELDREEFERRRGRRNIAIGLSVGAFAVLVFITFMVRYTPPQSASWGDSKPESQTGQSKADQSKASQSETKTNGGQ